MRFAALDVETANRRQRSICQVAVVVFEDGREIAGDVVLIDPEEDFEAMNVGLHRIHPDDVRGAMKFPALHARLGPILAGHHVVSHHTFDRIAIRQACEHYALEPFDCRWLDSCVVSRKTWPDLKASGGYGLANLADHFGIHFTHHDALEDARAAGLVMLRAIEESGAGLDHWEAVCAPRSRGNYAGSKRDVTREGDGDGPLLGETVVFTGNFTVDKYDLADMAHIAGAAVRDRVTRETTMLVVGYLHPDVVGADGKSGNLRKAERLVAKGSRIPFIIEDDFRELVRGPGGFD